MSVIFVLKVNTCILERMSMFSMCSVLRESGDRDLRVSVHLKDKTSKTGGPTFPIVAGLSTCTAKLLEVCPAPRWATVSSGQDSPVCLKIYIYGFVIFALQQ